jgi:hypothetical protein
LPAEFSAEVVHDALLNGRGNQQYFNWKRLVNMRVKGSRLATGRTPHGICSSVVEKAGRGEVQGIFTERERKRCWVELV